MPGVGNDVVDLKDPANRGKSGDERFLDRVCTVEEREMLDGARSPDPLLWSLWAAKEAAYKAVSRGDPSVSSVPRRYPVHLDPPRSHLDGGGADEAEGPLTGRVITPRGEVALRVTVTAEYVHALAAGSEADFAGIIQRVDRMDGVGDLGDASAQVRTRLLTDISRRLGCPIADLEVRKEPPGSDAPRVFLRGRPLAAEVSLSHDGRFCAFALAFR